MSERNKIFRKAALDRLASPEQLDELVQITDARAWFALLTLALLLAAALTWSFLGRMQTKVSGEGLLMRGGQLLKVSAPVSGQIGQMVAGTGQVLTQGQIVATLLQPRLADQLKAAISQVTQLKRQQAELTEAAAKKAAGEKALLDIRRSNLNQLIKDRAEQSAWLKNELQLQEKAAGGAPGSNAALISARQAYYSALQQLDAANGDLKEISHEEEQLNSQKTAELIAIDSALNQMEQRSSELQTQLDRSTSILSPFSGRVLEVVAKSGELLSEGSYVLSMEPLDKSLQAVVFVQANEGKKVRKGMPIQIIPSTFQKLEFGYVVGKVQFVADYPATRQAVMTVLENEQLVNKMLANGAPITLYADLIPNPKTPTGFRWSSSDGPPSEIHAGTPCAASIIISEQRPITLLFPSLQKWLVL